MAILPSMSLETPAVGASRNTWGTVVNADLVKIDAHNHISGKGEPVPSAGINIDADLSFNSLYGPKDLHALTFASVVALSDNAFNKSLFVNSADNQLYFRDRLGTNVKLTVDGALNVAGFSGGIGGDYAAASALVTFDDANKRYKFLDGADNFARVDAGGIRLTEIGTVDVLGVTLQVPAALAASYAITLPLAVPAATSLVQMDTVGTLTAVNTGIDNITLAVNKSVTISGTGDYKHAGRVMSINGSAGTALAANWVNDVATGQFKTSVGNGILAVSIPIDVGDRITAATFTMIGDGAADVSVVLAMLGTTMVPANLATLTVNNEPAAWSTKTLTVTPRTLLTGESSVITFLSSAAGLSIGNINITRTRP